MDQLFSTAMNMLIHYRLKYTICFEMHFPCKSSSQSSIPEQSDIWGFLMDPCVLDTKNTWNIVRHTINMWAKCSFTNADGISDTDT